MASFDGRVDADRHAADGRAHVPLCTEMVAAAGEEGGDDTDNFPAAVNESIYVMVSVPYLSFAVVGFLVYRGVKKNREYIDGLNWRRGPEPIRLIAKHISIDTIARPLPGVVSCPLGASFWPVPRQLGAFGDRSAISPFWKTCRPCPPSKCSARSPPCRTTSSRWSA